MTDWTAMSERQRDDWIAEHVMGWRRPDAFWKKPDGEVVLAIPNYSTDPEAALAVVEAMGERGWQFHCCRVDKDRWDVDFVGDVFDADGGREYGEAHAAPTFPAAVAEAAFKAIGRETD